TFDVYFDGNLVGFDYGFRYDSQTHFSRIVFSGNPEMEIFLDGFYAGATPSGWDNQSGDGIDDDWKAAHNLSLAGDVRDDDTDADGLNNLEEYFLGTNPILADTSRDGLFDGEAVALGVDPLSPSNLFPVALP